MRVLHVVTLASPDCAYGGPLRVAFNQANALRDRGHEITVAAAASGYQPLPQAIDAVPVRLFRHKTLIPGTGFAGRYGQGMIRWLNRAATDYDLLHVHIARDLVTLPAARLAQRRGVPVVLQPHGMIDATDKLLARPLDRWWTKPTLAAASAVFALTEHEAEDLRNVVGGPLRVTLLPNGVPAYPSPPQIPHGPPEVLFLARLHPRKRPEVFVEMAIELLRRGFDARFALVGPDEGSGAEVTALINESAFGGRIRWEGPISPERAVERLARATIYVLPSVDEPSGMSVLEAMSVARPVVVTESCGLAPVIRQTGSGRVVGHDTDSLINAVADLLDNPVDAGNAGLSGQRVVRETMTMNGISARLEETYLDIVGRCA
ncbi:glycosyltransferase [Skermania sp. ID1734]|uniref:glycosyltransferase n=1 Tax=Skermania sp. ID1734 TaxID=2597516 RepID=UPI00117CAFFD|nr:glycosyltransferase [Skermania sp. ID1734]TSE00409.1 glycosyltransferase [Skermania sp. ID1734]